MTEPREDLLGERVGHIRIVEVLGQGGMGTVYLGEDESLHRTVAVKAIRGAHRLHREAKARFLREARMLSKMNHRNICVVHDLIEHEDSDYLVLEFVPGASLREVLSQELTEQQKLAIARQLLEVLAAVHGEGLIHRDLKPENIIVKPDGEITVLDFGLARSVQDDAALSLGRSAGGVVEPAPGSHGDETTPLKFESDSMMVRTSLGTLVGTAGYMSPEQARAEPATAASDMYSAGLILQELFTGKPAFRKDVEAQVLVINAAQGKTLPVTGLAPDLTALIERLKALAPGARPSAVDALAQLQRVADRPRRRRRRAIVAAVWVALVALTGGMAFQWVRASQEAERATREAVTAREVSDFLVGLFEQSNPEQARGASLSAEEILHRGAERLGESLEEQPLVRSRLLLTIGKVYQEMGLYADAVPLLEEAVGIREGELGELHADVAEVVSLLGDCLRKNGEYDRARTQLERALALYSRLGEPLPLENARALTYLGILHENAGRFPEAEANLRRALGLYENELGSDHLFVARCLTNLAILTARQGRVGDAEPMFRRIVKIEEEALGPDHPDVAQAYNNHAIALKILQRYDEAEPLYRRSLEIEEKVLGSEHPDLAKSLQNYANFLVQTGLYEKAEPVYLRACEIARTALGTAHPELGRCLFNLGALYDEQGRLEEAEARYAEALSIRQQTLGPNHPDLGSNLLSLAKLYRRLGRANRAEECYRRSLAVLSAALAEAHPQRREAIDEFASFLREQGRGEEAEAVESGDVVTSRKSGPGE